jgi:hypothetical protein
VITRAPQLEKAVIGTAVVMAVVMMASCAATRSSSPKQIATSNPTVTYQYRSDDELIQANRRAIAFCEPHQSLPQAQSFSTDSEGRRVVVFECVRTQTNAAVALSDSDLRYNYRTDQELLKVSRNSQVHCVNSGKPEMDSNIVVNADGSKTVTFHCRAS